MCGLVCVCAFVCACVRVWESVTSVGECASVNTSEWVRMCSTSLPSNSVPGCAMVCVCAVLFSPLHCRSRVRGFTVQQSHTHSPPYYDGHYVVCRHTYTYLAIAMCIIYFITNAHTIQHPILMHVS